MKALFDTSSKKILADSNRPIAALGNNCLLASEILPDTIEIVFAGVENCGCVYVPPGLGDPLWVKAVSSVPNGTYYLNKYCSQYLFDGIPYYRGYFSKTLTVRRYFSSECTGDYTEFDISDTLIVTVNFVVTNGIWQFNVTAGWSSDPGWWWAEEYGDDFAYFFSGAGYFKNFTEGGICCEGVQDNATPCNWGTEEGTWALWSGGTATITICRDFEASPCDEEYPPTTTTPTTTSTTTSTSTTTTTTTTSTTTTTETTSTTTTVTTTSTSTTTTTTTPELTFDCCPPGAPTQLPYLELTLSGIGLEGDCDGCKPYGGGCANRTLDANKTIILEAGGGCTWYWTGSVKIGELYFYYNGPPCACSGEHDTLDYYLTGAIVVVGESGEINVWQGTGMLFTYSGPLGCNDIRTNQNTSCYTGGTAHVQAYA